MSTELKDLNSAELVDYYNKAAKKLGEKPVKRFANKDTGIKRTHAILLKLKSNGSKAKNGGTGKGRPAKELNLKPHVTGVPVREDSLGEKAVAMLKRGTTRDKLAALIGGPNGPGRVRTLLLRLNAHNGIGIRQTGDNFKSVTK